MHVCVAASVHRLCSDTQQASEQLLFEGSRTQQMNHSWAQCAAGAVGLYLALTGTRLKTPEDLLYAGLGTHYVPSKRIPELRQSLAKPLQPQSEQQTLQEVLDRIQPFTEQVLCNTLGCSSWLAVASSRHVVHRSCKRAHILFMSILIHTGHSSGYLSSCQAWVT